MLQRRGAGLYSTLSLGDPFSPWIFALWLYAIECGLWEWDIPFYVVAAIPNCLLVSQKWCIRSVLVLGPAFSMPWPEDVEYRFQEITIQRIFRLLLQY